MQTIVMMQHGSHLYGTNGPTSDLDFKGVGFPSLEEILMDRVPKQWAAPKRSKAEGEKNGPDDIDRETYSLGYFVDMACGGQTVCLDMLHAPPSALLEVSETWAELVAMRSQFYTRSMDSLIGYARRQAAKYGIKGTRVATLRQVLDLLESFPPTSRLKDVWDQLPEGEFCVKHPPPAIHNNVAIYEVCQRRLLATMSVAYALDPLKKAFASYGERALLAETNTGIDWKAISHAFRAAYQMEAIYTAGGFTYPLQQTEFLKAVKAGNLPFKDVGPELEAIIDRVEQLALASKLPETVDREAVDAWLYNRMFDYVRYQTT